MPETCVVIIMLYNSFEYYIIIEYVDKKAAKVICLTGNQDIH